MSALAEGSLEAQVRRASIEVGGAAVEVVHAAALGDLRGHLVIAPDIGGLRPLFDDMCRRLATRGLATCAPEPFARLAARSGLDLPGRMEKVKDLDDATQIGDLVAAADFLDREHGAREACLIGFCMGGYYALKAAASGRFARAVSFYGMIRTPEQWGGPGHRSPLETAREVCPMMAIVGGKDVWTPSSDVEALKEAWAEDAENVIDVFPDAEHGFVHDPERPAHRPADAEKAWQRALAFLGLT